MYKKVKFYIQVQVLGTKFNFRDYPEDHEVVVSLLEGKVELNNLLKKVFPIVSSYTSPIPTYPGGYWAWAFCSKTVEPLSFIDEKRCEEITKQCKIYNKDYHMARFALPTFLDDLTNI